MEWASIKNILLAACSMLLFSCEGYIKITGNVVNATDNTPVEGARVELLKVPVDSVAISRDSGWFTIGSRMMGMVRKPGYSVRITKEGYQPFETQMTKEATQRYKQGARFIFPMRPEKQTD